MNAANVESNLLNQVRVVSVGQVFPIWVQRTTCVFVTVGKYALLLHIVIALFRNVSMVISLAHFLYSLVVILLYCWSTMLSGCGGQYYGAFVNCKFRLFGRSFLQCCTWKINTIYEYSPSQTLNSLHS